MPRALRATSSGIKHEHIDPWSDEITVVSAQPSSTSVIPVNDTAELSVGLPIKWVQGANTGYGIITAVVANTSVTIAGRALTVSTDIDEFYFGWPERIVVVNFFISGTYADANNTTALASDMNTYFRWDFPTAYLVSFLVRHVTNDGGATQPKVNLTVAGSVVSTENTNDGPLASTSWVRNSAVAINAANYAVSFEDNIEIDITAGTNGDAENLTVQAIFVLE